jgi:hypothetical protein
LYLSLKDYAQAFERYLPFKDDMDLLGNEKIVTEGLDIDTFYESPIPNPFKADSVHPVESALLYAKGCSYRDALRLFKKFRRHALEYLEPQWEELDSAATSMNLFIKEEKRDGGVLDVYDIFGIQISKKTLTKKRDEALFLLECYAAALERGMPRDIKKQFYAQQRRIDAIYHSMERHFNLSRLRLIYEIRDFKHWRKWFQVAVDELDKQYYEIRATRQKLFDWDISNELRCNIKIFKTLDHDERTKWEINEPKVGCEPEYHTNESEGRSDYHSDDSFPPFQDYYITYGSDSYNNDQASFEWQNDDDAEDGGEYESWATGAENTWAEFEGEATTQLPVYYSENGVEGDNEIISEDIEHIQYSEDSGDLYD